MKFSINSFHLRASVLYRTAEVQYKCNNYDPSQLVVMGFYEAALHVLSLVQKNELHNWPVIISNKHIQNTVLSIDMDAKHAMVLAKWNGKPHEINKIVCEHKRGLLPPSNAFTFDITCYGLLKFIFIC